LTVKLVTFAYVEPGVSLTETLVRVAPVAEICPPKEYLTVVPLLGELGFVQGVEGEQT